MCSGKQPRLTVAGEPRSPFWSQGFTTSPTPWESAFPEQKFKIPFFETIITKCYIPYQLRHLRDSPLMLISQGEMDNPAVRPVTIETHHMSLGPALLGWTAPEGRYGK